MHFFGLHHCWQEHKADLLFIEGRHWVIVGKVGKGTSCIRDCIGFVLQVRILVAAHSLATVLQVWEFSYCHCTSLVAKAQVGSVIVLVFC